MLNKDNAIFWMNETLKLALQSSDPSVQNAAIIMRDYPTMYNPATAHIGVQVPVGWGVNEFPKGLSDEAVRWERPGKYMWVEHAERNAIYQVAYDGLHNFGSWNTTMFCPWAACADCARAIVQSGVTTLYRFPLGEHDGWSESIAAGEEILRYGSVKVIELDLDDCDIPEGLRLGQFRD